MLNIKRTLLYITIVSYLKMVVSIRIKKKKKKSLHRNTKSTTKFLQKMKTITATTYC